MLGNGHDLPRQEKTGWLAMLILVQTDDGRKNPDRKRKHG